MTRQIALALTLDEKGFHFDTGYGFRGLTVSEAPGGWNCVIRGLDKRNSPVYAMTVAPDPAQGIADLFSALSHGTGDRLWRHDRFASS